ncbi:DegT/DnrJ/EryC1/StrS family aminotransferase, partial [Candidatus Jorgensenbacteria bacterium]|nr:DegT/DnrJ/EryC1/StrS family aminotransferase [Candidatus Jorgensenbacteria bacterium]
CAQAVGARINGRHVGTFGDAACFSFYPTKNLGAMGDGGAVATNNRKLSEKIRRLRMYGEDKRYHSVELSTHSRLDEIQAAILSVRLKRLKSELRKRVSLANRYRRLLPVEIQIPPTRMKQIYHASHLFVIRSAQRDRLKNFLKKGKIESVVHYPSPIHLQPAFSSLRYKNGDFPVAELACRQVLSLPLFPGLSEGAQDRIVKAVKQGMAI